MLARTHFVIAGVAWQSRPRVPTGKPNQEVCMDTPAGRNGAADVVLVTVNKSILIILFIHVNFPFGKMGTRRV